MTIIESRLQAVQAIAKILDEFEDPADIHAILGAVMSLVADLDDEEDDDDDGGGTPVEKEDDEDDEDSPLLDNPIQMRLVGNG